jgi:P27 family predicted phage terminase small subunit
VAGRIPKPTKLKRLQGNPGKRKINTREPVFEAELPAAPAHLRGEALCEWQRVCAQLHPLGLLTAVDRNSLAVYCLAYAEWIEADNMVKQQGKVLISDKGNSYLNPWVGIRNKAAEQMHKISQQFGMTPASRTRVATPRPDDDDDFGEYMKQRRGK